MDLSVVIPTYNRVATLTLTLEALARQSVKPAAFEVLVVDDGSEDDTAEQVRKIQLDYPVPLHYFYQPNRKQGTARNLGARSAQGHLLLFLGDDIVPTQSLLSEHLQAHQVHNTSPGCSPKLVVIGYITWPPTLNRTPFLEYIGEQGWQFGFSLIEDPNDVDFNYFYSSNVSINRAFFLESGGFDESFKEYGWEDIELSLRLKNRGMKLIYCSGAVAHHHHEVRIASFAERQRKVGQSAWNFYHRHPQMANFLGIDRIPEYSTIDRLKFWLLGRLYRTFERSDMFSLSRYYPDLMTYYYTQGLIAGRTSSVSEASSDADNGV